MNNFMTECSIRKKNSFFLRKEVKILLHANTFENVSLYKRNGSRSGYLPTTDVFTVILTLVIIQVIILSYALFHRIHYINGFFGNSIASQFSMFFNVDTLHVSQDKVLLTNAVWR